MDQQTETGDSTVSTTATAAAAAADVALVTKKDSTAG